MTGDLKTNIDGIYAAGDQLFASDCAGLHVPQDTMREEKRQITVIRSKNWLRSTRQKWMRRENVCMHR